MKRLLAVLLPALCVLAGTLADARDPSLLFRDIAREAGITFAHHAAPEKK
jgi:hypothetical protein